MVSTWKVFFMAVGLLLLFSCQDDYDEMDKYNPVTDSFILVDYYEGVYKFVQADNEYNIGILEGLIEIPAGFKKFTSDEPDTYYQVDLRITGIQQDNVRVKYQRYTGTSDYYQVKQKSDFKKVECTVIRMPLYNDYMYYLIPD